MFRKIGVYFIFLKCNCLLYVNIFFFNLLNLEILKIILKVDLYEKGNWLFCYLIKYVDYVYDDSNFFYDIFVMEIKILNKFMM